MWSNFRYILEVDIVGYVDGLGVKYEEKESRMILRFFWLRCWQEGVAIKRVRVDFR